MMLSAFRCITLLACLLVVLAGCGSDIRNIPPASEANIGGSGGAGMLTIGWDKVMAESYDLFMGTIAGGAESGRKITNVADPIEITDLQIGATYYFVLSANNNGRSSLRTREVAHKIQGADDSIHIAFPAGTGEITLDWDPNREASAYNIYWRNSPGVTRQNGIKISNVDAPQKLTGLIPGVPYYFVVTAVGKTGAESGISDEISYQSQ